MLPAKLNCRRSLFYRHYGDPRMCFLLLNKLLCLINVTLTAEKNSIEIETFDIVLSKMIHFFFKKEGKLCGEQFKICVA